MLVWISAVVICRWLLLLLLVILMMVADDNSINAVAAKFNLIAEQNIPNQNILLDKPIINTVLSIFRNLRDLLFKKKNQETKSCLFKLLDWYFIVTLNETSTMFLFLLNIRWSVRLTWLSDYFLLSGYFFSLVNLLYPCV